MIVFVIITILLEKKIQSVMLIEDIKIIMHHIFK